MPVRVNLRKKITVTSETRYDVRLMNDLGLCLLSTMAVTQEEGKQIARDWRDAASYCDHVRQVRGEDCLVSHRQCMDPVYLERFDRRLALLQGARSGKW